MIYPSIPTINVDSNTLPYNPILNSYTTNLNRKFYFK